MIEYPKFSPPKTEKDPIPIQFILFILYVCFYLLLVVCTGIIRTLNHLLNWFLSMKSMRLRGLFAAHNKSKKVFIFGSPHAGKSTLLACLVHYLSNSEGYTFRRDPDLNAEGVKVIEELSKALDAGDFPPPTRPGFWQRVLFEYHKGESLQKLSYNFQEIAGEMAEVFDPSNSRHHEMNQELKGFLLNSNGTIIIASAKPETTNEKEVLNNFLELLYRRGYNRPILFILSKFDEVSADYSDEVQAARAIYTNSIKLLERDSNSSLLGFSVGTVMDGKILENLSGQNMPDILEWLEGI